MFDTIDKLEPQVLEAFEQEVINEFKDGRAALEDLPGDPGPLNIDVNGVYDLGFLTSRHIKRQIRSLDLSYRIGDNYSSRDCKAMVELTWDYPGVQRLKKVKHIRYFDLC
jgi:hypothetical protein